MRTRTAVCALVIAGAALLGSSATPAMADPGATARSCVPQPASGNVHGAGSVHLGAAHYQDTDAWYDREKNTISAVTTTISNNWFGGFHATPAVILSDSCGNVVGRAYPGRAFWASGKYEGNGRRTDKWGSTDREYQALFSPEAQKWATKLDVHSVWTPKPRWGPILDCLKRKVAEDPWQTVTVAGFIGQVASCV